MSLQATLSRWFAFHAFVQLSVVCSGVYVTTQWSFEHKQEQEFGRHQAVVERAALETAYPMDIDALRHKLAEYFVSHSNVAVALEADDQLLYESEASSKRTNWRERTSSIAGAAVNGRPIQLTMWLDVEGDTTILRRLKWTLAAAAVLGSFIVSLTGALLVQRGLRPLKRLAEETGAAGPDRPGLQINALHYAKELRPWIVQFNGLLGRVEAAYAQLEAFNADVAHELRTPLANMIAQAEIELGRDRNRSELKEVLESQLEEARRLTGIVTDMLFMSQADRGAKARRTAPRSLADQVLAVAEFQEAVLEDAGISLVVEGEARVPMDVGLVRRAVSNLISNAQRYAERGSVIKVIIERQGDAIRLAVQNHGTAIQPEALPRLFERFYRADASRAESATHHGLGLAIVAAIARMHGGTTFAECEHGLTTIGLTLAYEAPTDA
ncbi:heavy metal sensor histidine kinase [Variovorax dokdonensis]|uniref:Sensor protein n=1 Tax=Variovorax dokdonensis TaxID=344883 RepID=A0ABT7NGH5_9BURK|nr:heavy metal sensor histidine kinase [Variovorax dokdonensis]MDM0047017.1 heavy metal sensor histidine kinase [Variovorax dokdonensis]